MKIRRWLIVMAFPAVVLALPRPGAAASAKTAYETAFAREQALRAAAQRGEDPTLKQIRELIAAYETVVRRFPASGYADNALYQAGMLALEAYRRLVDDPDQRTAVRLLSALVTRYPSSSLVPKATARLAELGSSPATASVGAPSPPAAQTTSGKSSDGEPAPKAAATEPAANAGAASVSRDARTRPVVIKTVRRVILPEVVRVLIELEDEVPFHEERVENPARMFVDLKGTRTAAGVSDAVLNYPDDAIRQIRIGRHPQNTTRVVIDLADVAQYTVFTLYNPYRVIIDCERRPGIVAGVATVPLSPRLPAVRPAEAAPEVKGSTGLLDASPASDGARAEPLVAAVPSPPKVATSPLPSRNLQGGFSLSRQLGLGVARVVIDPGHGGHDPGAQGAAGVVESTLVLDVALRLEKLLKDSGVDVVMTRRTDEFIPLEERTAIANRESADLFLSIHANASRNNGARGVETYFLNFASNPDAQAVAARENLTSGRTMNNLPDIVRAITLNNKVNESRDFATMVQQSMVQRLRAPKNPVRDLGVKQAPFVVLIGAAMPSALAEISFVTNRQDAAQLKSSPYRQRIAEALFSAVTRYQRSLKASRSVARREAQEK
jgi:N-acetylmuramoyl-L-alanine amidase